MTGDEYWVEGFADCQKAVAKYIRRRLRCSFFERAEEEGIRKILDALESDEFSVWIGAGCPE